MHCHQQPLLGRLRHPDLMMIQRGSFVKWPCEHGQQRHTCPTQ
jgi:hypothetical protein